MRLNCSIPQNRFIINPFIIYSLIWLIVLLTYSLNWSYLCPNNLTFYYPFIIITCIISGLIGIRLYKKRIFSYSFNKCINLKKITRYNKILYLLFILEIIASKSIPILGYLTGNTNIEYTDFGIPIIHVIVANGFVVICLCSYYSYFCTSIKHEKKRYLLNLVFSIIPFLLMFNRGGLMFCILGCFIMYLMHCKNIKKSVLGLIFATLLVLFGFGVLGNLRTDVKGVNNIILQFGEATDEFEASWIPKEFFWPYIYVSSPIANAQLMMDKSDNDLNLTDLTSFAIFEMTPELLSKRIQAEGLQEKEMDKILYAFNVASVYGMSAKYVSWLGPIILYVFWILFVIITIGLIPKHSPFYPIVIVSVSIITIMNTFDNMFVFMGLIPQPLFIIIACYNIRLHERKNINLCGYLQSNNH